MKLDQKLVQAAIDFVNQRFPTGLEVGAAAVYLEDGRILVSTSPRVENESVAVCHEMGAYCEAYKLNQKITASVCVTREQDGFYILTPCGVCQERLWTWGEKVECAVPAGDDPRKWRSIPLSELSPHYWRKPFMKK